MTDITVLVLVTTVSVGVFLLMFGLVGVVAVARDAIATLHHAVQIMRAPELEEAERERAIQAAAIRLIVASGSLILRSALCLIAAFVPILAADWVGIASKAATLAFMERWDVILIVSLLITFGYVLYFRICRR